MIVRLTGGLGNTLYQYAFGKGMEAYYNEPVKFDWRRSTWDYALDEFNVDVKLRTPIGNEQVYDEGCFNFDPQVYLQSKDTYFRGYWQTERYFVNHEKLRQDFTFKNPFRHDVEETARMLRDVNSVSLHIRRADYLSPGTEAYHGNLGHAFMAKGYYTNAIEYIKSKTSNPKFFVFSDDPEWCRQQFPFEVISGLTNKFEDLYLMSQCHHSIIANSTFSWFGAWLREYPGKIVTAPKKWFNNDLDTTDIIPTRWTRL